VTTATAERDPIVAPESDRLAIASIERALERETVPRVAQLISPDGDQIELPASLYAVLSRAAHELSRGRGVAILPVGMELTTQQAAELLNVSRPFLIQMLEHGEVPFHMVGTHRRIRLEDVLAYRRSRSEGRRQALRQLTEEAQELDIYEP
jgi:excisionase family DNA binding protein